MTELTDTHCHIHDVELGLIGDSRLLNARQSAADPSPDAMIKRAHKSGVSRLICVGSTLDNSKRAVDFVQSRLGCWASIGIHPHDAKAGQTALDDIAALANSGATELAAGDPKASTSSLRGSTKTLVATGDTSGAPQSRTASTLASMSGEGDLRGRTRGVARSDKIVAVGEIGLDYFYNHSSKKEQAIALRFQIELALAHDLPIIFHVREAFDDFWPIFDSYQNIRGVLHSFTDSHVNFTAAMERDLYIGVNGIMTFTKVTEQLQVAKEVPLQKLLLETDAPFLTPKPLRGTVNEPAYVRLIAEFLADLRGESLADIATQTSKNAQRLFALS